MTVHVQDGPRRIDVDVHQGLPRAFWDRMPRPWRDMRAPGGIAWPAASLGHTGYRADVHTPSGEHFDTEPRFVVERLLDPYRIDAAILTGNAGALGICTHPNARFALAFAQAYNDWLAEVWLPHDPRLKGSMLIAPLDVPGSVAEIERFGDHPDVVQVLMPASAPRLYGDPSFWPIYAAAAERGLPVTFAPELLRRIFDDLRAERSLLFASDWPHWDFDDPEAALRPLSPALRERVLSENALDTYPKLRRVATPS